MVLLKGWLKDAPNHVERARERAVLLERGEQHGPLHAAGQRVPARKLGGSGRLESTADIAVAVSPLKMIPQWDSVGDLEFLSDGVYMEVRPSTSGLQYVHIPVDLPSALFGTTTKLKSARICYRCDQAGSFVSTTILSQGTDSGTVSQSINDTTDRASTSWDCYTVTDSAPDAIQGSVYIQLTLSFAGTGSTHDIRIGNIALGLTEQ